MIFPLCFLLVGVSAAPLQPIFSDQLDDAAPLQPIFSDQLALDGSHSAPGSLTSANQLVGGAAVAGVTNAPLHPLTSVGSPIGQSPIQPATGGEPSTSGDGASQLQVQSVASVGGGTATEGKQIILIIGGETTFSGSQGAIMGGQSHPQAQSPIKAQDNDVAPGTQIINLILGGEKGESAPLVSQPTPQTQSSPEDGAKATTATVSEEGIPSSFGGAIVNGSAGAAPGGTAPMPVARQPQIL